MEGGTLFCVGQNYDHWKTNQVHIQMNYSGSWDLVVGFPNITKQEVRELQDGDFTIAYTIIDDVLFFLFKAGNMEWADAPFEPRLYESSMDYPEIEDNEVGAALTLYIVDTYSGRLMGLRTIGLGNGFSNKLHTFCREKDKVRLLTKEQFSKQVQGVYRKYPRSDDMLKCVKPENIFIIAK